MLKVRGGIIKEILKTLYWQNKEKYFENVECKKNPVKV